MKVDSCGEATITPGNLTRILKKSLPVTLGLAGTVIGSFWLSQTRWELLAIMGLSGVVFLLLVALNQRALSRPKIYNSEATYTSEAGWNLLQLGFYIWLASLAIGWRQLWLTTNLRIHPSELLVWGLFLWLLLQGKGLKGALPGSVKIFMVLSSIGLFTAYSRGIAWDVILAEFKAFLVIIPIIYIVHEIIHTPRQWRASLLIIALVTFYISLLGLIEYFSPSLISPLQGILFTEQNILYSQQGFARAAFTFWGSPIVNVYLSMVLVPILGQARVEQKLVWRLFLWATIILCALGIYIAGGRGSWLGASSALALYVFFSAKGGWLKFLLLLLVSYNAAPYVLPAEVVGSLYATFDSEEYYDTSALEREARAQAGLELIERNPWVGHGWGASGWVHSDLIQMGANLGLPTLAFFLIWYLSRVGRVYGFIRRTAQWQPEAYEYSRGLLAGLLAAFVSLAVQSIYVIPPLIIPLWFLLAMVDRLPVLVEEASA